MKIACISDLHGYLIEYPSPFWKGLEECEILFICGDIVPLSIQYNMHKSKKWLIKEFKTWAESLPVEKVYFIAGNHDLWFERNERAAKSIFAKGDKVTYLKNELIEHISIQDSNLYRVFGTPYCHEFGNWPFMRTNEILIENFKHIPENIDILISHDAPYGTSDICLEGLAADNKHKGNIPLRDAIIEKNPKYCLHGHLHSSNHNEEILNNTKVYNTSIVDESYQIQYYPIIIKL